MEEVEAEHCDDQRGSLFQHLLKEENPSLTSLCPRDGWKHPIPEEGLGQALWRSMQSKMRGEETCCLRKSGKNWNCIWGQSCWSSHCLCLCLYPGLCLDLYLGPCRGHGCSFCGCCCHGGCENGGGCDVSGGCVHLIESPGCLAGTPCRPCVLSGDGNDENGTLRKSLCLAGGGMMTFWSQQPLARSGPLSLYPGLAPYLPLGADHTGWQEAVEALWSGALCVAQALQHWGMRGSTAAHWDGMMGLGDT